MGHALRGKRRQVTRFHTPIPVVNLSVVLFRLAAHPLAHIKFLAVGFPPCRGVLVLLAAGFKALGAPARIVAVTVPGSVNVFRGRPLLSALPGRLS
jgi:hypothetical protein